MLAAAKVAAADSDVRRAPERELEDARYEAALAARRYEVVDPAKRLVARELEARWNATLERSADLERRMAAVDVDNSRRPCIDRAGLMALAHDLPAAWNAPGTSMRTKQRLTRILIEKVVIDLDDGANETRLAIHWRGGRHTELGVARVRCGRYPADRHLGAVEVMRKLGGRWSDLQLAVTLNRIRCKASDGRTWTTVRVREMRERLGIAEFDPASATAATISAEEAARRLKICIGSIHKLIGQGVLPAVQLFPSAPWQIPTSALESEPVRMGVQRIVARRPRRRLRSQDDRTLRLPTI